MTTITIYKTVYITDDAGNVLEITISSHGLLDIKCPNGIKFEAIDAVGLINQLDING